MRIEFKRNIRDEEIEELDAGTILLSENNYFHLIIVNLDSFKVFDLEECVLRCYPNRDCFEYNYPTKEVYTEDDFKIIIKKGINLE